MGTKKWILITIIILLFSGCDQTTENRYLVGAEKKVNQTWIDSPLMNATLPIEPYLIQFHGAVQSDPCGFDVLINDDLHSTVSPILELSDENLIYGEVSWTPITHGSFQIEVRTICQNVPDSSAFVNIFIQGDDKVELTEEVQVVEACTFTAKVDLNCRSGPGDDFESLGFLLLNQTSPIVGKSGDGSYWYVKAPDTNERCAVPNSTEFGETAGDCSEVPEVIAHTPTPQPPFVHVTKNTYCRLGPGYPYLGVLYVGETSEIFAKDPWGHYWFIENPADTGSGCWIWNGYATPEGPTENLPVFTPHPTYTPTATFTPTAAPVCSDYNNESDCIEAGCTWVWGMAQGCRE